MNILIDKIRIKNFRALQDVEVDLKPVTLLVGTNNTGKTTLLRALNTVLGASRNQLNKDDLFIDKEGKQPEKIITIDIRIIPVDDEGQRVKQFEPAWSGALGGSDYIMIDQDQDFLAFRSEYIFEEDIPAIKYYLITNWDSKTASTEFGGINRIRNILKMYLIDAQRDLQEDLALRTSFFGRMASQLDKDYDNEVEKLEEITNLIKELNDKIISDSDILTHLKDKLSELNQTTQTKGEGVSISPIPKKIRDLHKGIKVDFQDNGSESFGMEYHGMGTRSWASILTVGAYIDWESKNVEAKKDAGIDTDLFFPIVGLEEPEAHLHPNAQRTLYKQLEGFRGQKIISTHSPYIAGQADLAELRHFYKETDSANISFLNTDLLNADEKRKITNEVIQTQGEILFSKIVVLFEGETEKQSFPVFAEKYWDTNVFTLGITFIDVKGNNYKPFVLLAKSLNIPWFIFSDYDKGNIKKGVDNFLKTIGYINPENTTIDKVLKLGKSIEEYLISEGYQQELKNGINKWYLQTLTEETPSQQILAGQTRVNSYTDEELLKDISSDDGKVRYSYHWASEISNLGDGDRAIPPKIKELFDKISEVLNLSNNVS